MYKDNPILPEGLDLEQIMHQIQLDEELGSEEDDSEEEEGKYLFFISASFSYRRLTFCWFPVVETKEGIEDRTEVNLVNLRRIIYLTIMNTLNYEEAVHKLLKIELQEGQKVRTFFGFVA